MLVRKGLNLNVETVQIKMAPTLDTLIVAEKAT
jgi:hypothetical protein